MATFPTDHRKYCMLDPNLHGTFQPSGKQTGSYNSVRSENISMNKLYISHWKRKHVIFYKFSDILRLVSDPFWNFFTIFNEVTVWEANVSVWE